MKWSFRLAREMRTDELRRQHFIVFCIRIFITKEKTIAMVYGRD
jgi:hypothetical protein